MTAAQIFISYRRDDTAGYARALYDALAREFGAERVFIDVDDIGAGLAFDEAIHQAVGASEVLLVLIGPRWLAGHDGGLPRLHQPDDFVRQEVVAGLARGMRVIPLLFDGAAMPGEAQLPGPLQPLARRQALVMDATRFAADTERLVAVLRDALGAAPAPAAAAPSSGVAAHRPSRRWALASAAAGLLAAGGWALWPRVGPPAAPAAPARAAVNGRWTAHVVYDWPNAEYDERFEFDGEGGDLFGSASFLRLARGIVEGRVDGDGLQFVTRTQETGGPSGVRDVTHRYRGRLVGDELQLVLQTENAGSPHVPVRFVAQRVGP
jgi:hypothetical protein